MSETWLDARVGGERTRGAILHAAAALAAVDGLDRLSVARLAAVLRMSKRDLSAYFGSKQGLYVAYIELTGTEARRVGFGTR